MRGVQDIFWNTKKFTGFQHLLNPISKKQEHPNFKQDSKDRGPVRRTVYLWIIACEILYTCAGVRGRS